MTRKSLAASLLLEAKMVEAKLEAKMEAKNRTSGQSVVNLPRPKRQSTRLWPWLTVLLIMGIVLLGGVSIITWTWLHTVTNSINTASTQPQLISYNVGRTTTYDDLSLSVLSAQYSTSFSDDLIHNAPAIVRLNMQITNKTGSSIAIVYYDVARLLLAGQQPVAPTNVQLASTVQKGATVRGWIDFPVAAGIGAELRSMRLQLGSASLNETLVTVPFSGTFDPNRFLNHVYQQSQDIYYYFKGYVLVYHLKSVDVRYSYDGAEVKAGQQYYVFNWTVDNNNGADVSPGYGFDYLRLLVNGGNKPPIDNTLPYTFKAGTNAIGGRVAFMAPAGMKSLTIAFLIQLTPGQRNYQVGL